MLVRAGPQFSCDGQATDAMQGLRISYCECPSAEEVRRGGEILAGLLGL